MPIYRYIKAPPRKIKLHIHRTNKKRVFIPSFILMGLGGFIITWALWPILSFALISAPALVSTVSPIASVEKVTSQIGKTIHDNSEIVSPAVLGVDTNEQGPDYADANIWFPSKPQKKTASSVNAYYLSIPKLKIQDAMVTINGDDLSHSLIHYGGTGLPGEYGTAVIFGHSVLPQFFNPKNYSTIFSTLPTLKIGDEIFLKYDSIVYKYSVYDMVVTDPNDLSILEQRFDDKHITLITCVPPGTYWKRLGVHAKIADNNSL